MNIIVGNVFGLLANFAGLKYFSEKNKDKICFWSCVMILIQAVSMVALSAWTGIIVLVMNFIRAILTWKDKFNKYIAIALVTGALIYTYFIYKSPLDLFSITGSALNTVGFLLMQKGKILTFRRLRTVASVLWVFYYLYIMSFTSLAFEIAYIIINVCETRKLIHGDGHHHHGHKKYKVA